MKNIARCLFLLFIALRLLQPSWMIAKKCNNLIVIFDPDEDEKVDGKTNAMTLKFIDAIQEKAAPIIINSNIVENFCFWKTEHEQLLNAVKEEGLRKKSYYLASKKAQELLAVLEESERFDYNEGYFAAALSLTDLTGDDWLCYSHKKADLVLLVPKDYISRRVSKSSIKNNVQMRECGFQLTDMEKVYNVFPRSMLNHLRTRTFEKSINVIDAFTSMFLIETSSKQDFATWNVYVNGHGAPAQKKKMPSMLAVPEAAKSLSNETVIPQSAVVAGIKFNDFIRLMNFFDNNVKTSFLHYATCFGGGYNRVFINKVLKQLKVNFIVSSQGINEESTFGWYPLFTPSESSGLVLSPRRFANFFSRLESFFGDQPIDVATKACQEGWQKDPIASIVSAIINVDRIEQNQPFVRIPAVGIFAALNIDKKVKIMTNSMAKMYEFEGGTIDFTNPDIKDVLVYPASINVPLRLGASVAIVFPTPQKIEQPHHVIHVFEEIISMDALSSVIPHFIFLNSSHSQITVIIKKLICLNDNHSALKTGNKQPLSVENVIIQITGELSSVGTYHAEADVMVLFMHNKKIYSFVQHIKDFSQNKTAILDLFKKVPFAVTESTQLVDFAAKIMDAKDMIELAAQPLTLATIVDQIDKKVEKDFSVQKPGALKKILLLQQLDSLEMATDEQHVMEQKRWLQQHKPEQSFATIINRQKKALIKLKKQINQLAIPQDLTKKEHNVLQKRIVKIQKKLNKNERL